MNKKIVLLLSFFLLMGLTLQVNAAERSSGSLAACDISVSIVSNGVQISVTTRATPQANEIGVKNVVLQEKVNGSWRNINISGGSEKNSSTYSGNVIYSSAVRGRSYRAYCTHYAVYSDGTKTLKNSSGELTYN